jgi:hypothetical protein
MAAQLPFISVIRLFVDNTVSSHVSRWLVFVNLKKICAADETLLQLVSRVLLFSGAAAREDVLAQNGFVLRALADLAAAPELLLSHVESCAVCGLGNVQDCRFAESLPCEGSRSSAENVSFVGKGSSERDITSCSTGSVSILARTETSVDSLSGYRPSVTTSLSIVPNVESYAV